MRTTWWDIKTDQLGWTRSDYHMQSFFQKIGAEIDTTIHDGWAYVLVYNAKKPSRSTIVKSKM